MTGKASAAFVAINADAGMDAIGSGLFVTGQATEDTPVSRIGVAVGTFAPDAVVISRVYREIERIVLGKLYSGPLRVASQARSTDIIVTINALVNIVSGRWRMASQAVELGAVVRIVMAVGTG